MDITLLPIDVLKQHEQVLKHTMATVEHDLLRDGVIRDPIVVDRKTMIILDGHHRYNVLKQMGAAYVPVYLVDYASSAVQVHSWKPGVHISKDDVMRAGLSGHLMPAKSSRHVIAGAPHDIDVPLALLQEARSDDTVSS
jgi:hypothetical protein